MSRRSIPWKRILAEFAVIFAGVTLGLVAEDWRQGRSDRAAATALLAELVEDLDADSIELSRLQVTASRWERDAVRLLRFIPDPESDPDSIIQASVSLSLYYRYRPVRSGYVALVDGGHLSGITDASVRRSIVAYYEQRQMLIARTWEDLLGLREDFVSRSRVHIAFVPSESTTALEPIPAQRLVSGRGVLASDQAFRAAVELQGVIAADMNRALGPQAMAANRDLASRIRTLLEQG
jgi:hypothetical protein